jgi:hypothetical protein
MPRINPKEIIMPSDFARDFTRLALGAATVALLGATALVAPAVWGGSDTAAWAEGQGSGKGGQGGSGSQGGSGAGQGGPSADSEGKGPQAGGPSETGGGKPVWAKEGIPEVELGRLNVARSPAKVLDQALAEAIKSLTPEMVDYYNLTLEQAQELLSLQFDSVSFIDSPLQNLALLGDLLEGGTALRDAGVTTDTMDLAAMLLGAASDKTVPISTETVIAVTTILGTPITGSAAAALAADAEAIRIAILAGHG